jgi:hypothetical protein
MTPSTATGGRRITNFSCRSVAGSGDHALVVGFSIAGDRPLTLLIRGLGPALRSFGTGNALSNPTLTLYQGSAVVASNTGWENQNAPDQVAAAAARVGAFPLDPGGDDAVLVTLPPGVYTAQVVSPGEDGQAMIELYDASE